MLQCKALSTGFTAGTVCIGHTSFVTTIAYAAPGVIAALPNGAIVSGSRDKRVVAWDPATGAAALDFTGHELDVTAVAVLPLTGTIVSGAMDKTIRVWRNGACVAVLHGMALQSSTFIFYVGNIFVGRVAPCLCDNTPQHNISG